MDNLAAQHEHAKSMNDKAAESANIVFKSLLLVNGGAAVAMLAFVSNLASSNIVDILPIVSPLSWFGWGVVAVVAAMTFSYFTTFSNVSVSYSDLAADAAAAARWRKSYTIFFALSFVSGMASLGFFMYGLWAVTEAVRQLVI
jgi:hypothetical protein